MGFWSRLFNRRTLQDAVGETRKVKVCGVVFHIKRLDAFDYLNGSKIMHQFYDIYKVDPVKAQESPVNKKVKQHYIDTFMSAIVKPELSRDESEGSKVHVEELFKIPDLVEQLYLEIIEFTYGKKKLKLSN